MFDCCVVKGMIMFDVCNMGSVCMMLGEHHRVCMCETSANDQFAYVRKVQCVLSLHM